MTKKEIAAKLDEELEKNEELKKAIGNDPKKKEAYIEKYYEAQDQNGGNPVIKDALCFTCIFSKSPVIQENGPLKGYCQIFSKAIGEGKPLGILHNGDDCPYYMKE